MKRYYPRRKSNRANSARSETSRIIHEQGSDLEREFETLYKQLELPPAIREYRFMKRRQFKFDFAWPEFRIAAEMEGGVGMKHGHHVSMTGYSSDCEKYNYAAMMGWQVLRFTSRMLKNGKAAEQMLMAFRKIKLPLDFV